MAPKGDYGKYCPWCDWSSTESTRIYLKDSSWTRCMTFFSHKHVIHEHAYAEEDEHNYKRCDCEDVRPAICVACA